MKSHFVKSCYVFKGFILTIGKLDFVVLKLVILLQTF